MSGAVDLEGRVVVVGAGLAGAELAISLRQLGHRGPVLLIGDEPHAPYQRPPLSKAVLQGKASEHDIRVRAEAAYAKAAVDVVLGVGVRSLDPLGQTLTLTDDTVVSYDGLALTTGGRPRRLPLGDDVDVHELYRLEDAVRLRQLLRPGARLLVVGGGFIGLEVAAAGIAAGADVTLVELQERLLARSCSPALAGRLASVHRERGVDLRCGVGIVGATRRSDGAVDVSLSGGTTVVVDHLVAGVGQVPNDQLAAEAGLAVADGVLVDEGCRTSDPHVVAAGDCARQQHGWLGRLVRLESQQNATEQARTAAATLVGADPTPAGVPWFWSDQYEHKLQMAGVPEPGCQELHRGEPAGPGPLSVLYVRDDTLVGVQTLDRPRDFVAARKLMAQRARLDLGRACDPEVPLGDLVR
ncbi:3-phenylpropionate/trans-cinnamate dioxygenase ferredoxin reductase subunit [Nocardioides zeae]|uniref:3-phenylpropionate/trans-cinnamate dioxygenase ferredoxin reductase subunit n=1 Tax=Nocardioides zeae TaxID=1457234 RepID=A0ACC6IE69_9ACTN|nr:FAD-dependent oxidoreductase [Nocardioides zeae]MDR6174172.1 3-phenylpropionate/trans-cinnamate dioxygenase ferredoxin reductase subunit [Nocardioides zeae]MDR6208979.1 3-phenylpropionate/trans-cinnamate dioxygenase ferredoxin reductase subunit [Nocardioides zeae]